MGKNGCVDYLNGPAPPHDTFDCIRLLMQKGSEPGQESPRDNFRSLGSGMDAVRLDRSGHVDQVFVNHRHQGNMVFLCQVAKDLVERMDIVRSVIGRQRDACQQHLDTRGFESREHRVQVLPRLIQREAAQPVVSAEFDNDDGRVALNNRSHIGSGVLCCRSAGPPVVNVVFVAGLLQIALQCRGVGLVWLKSQPRRDAVAIADDRWPFGARHRKRHGKQANRNEEPAAHRKRCPR